MWACAGMQYAESSTMTQSAQARRKFEVATVSRPREALVEDALLHARSIWAPRKWQILIFTYKSCVGPLIRCEVLNRSNRLAAASD